VQEAEAGTSHCVSQTTAVSASGETGAARPMLASFMVTRRQAVPDG
jgi:hypothetical protein